MGSKRKRQSKETESSAPAPKKHQKKSPPAEPIEEISTPIVHPLFLEDPKGPHLKREVKLYTEQLSSDDALERLEAADAVVQGLVSGEGVSEPTLQRHLERRLFRGLASDRKGARPGYSIVITEVLSQLYKEDGLAESKYTGLSFGKAVDILIAKTKPEGDTSGQEDKNHALGLLFGLECFVKANILFMDKTGERWELIFDQLLQLATKKPWARMQCGHVIVEALTQMNQKQAEKTLQKVQEAGFAGSPEGVGIWLTGRRKFPDMRFPSHPWGSSGNPLEHLKLLAKALKESSSPDGEQAKQTGSWNPQLHFVWALVLDQYIEDAKNEKEDVASEFSNFWKVAVDENLFSAAASDERKFWGFLLFQKTVRDAAPYEDLLGSIFSKNLVRCMINHSSNKSRFLHGAAVKSLRILKEVAEAIPKTMVTILPNLVSGNGVYHFDKVTKSKTVGDMLANVDDSVAGEVVAALVEPILDIDDEDEKEVESRRQTFGDYTLSMIRSVNISDDSEVAWLGAVGLPTLAKLAYTNDYECTPSLTDKSRTLIKNRLTSAFAHLMSSPNGFMYPCNLLQNLDPSAVPMDGAITSIKDKAISTMTKLLKKSKKAGDKEKRSLQTLALLYSLVIFQLYNGEADALTVLDELKLCYDKLVRGKQNDDSDVDASEVLVEILLSFMAKPSVLLRRAGQQVFEAFSSDINSEGLRLMTDVLESKESMQGQQELFDQEDEDMEDAGEGPVSDVEELDSDVEIIDVGANGDADFDEEDGGEEDDEEEDQDEDEDEDEDSAAEQDEETRKLEEALAKAYGAPTEDDSDDDADMTDSEMFEKDKLIENFLSQRKKSTSKKQEKKDARENIVNFKSRVLDLLEIYVKKQTTNPAALEILIPLLITMRTTTSGDVGKKSHGVISSFAQAYRKTKESSASDSASEITGRLELLKTIHEEASKNPAQTYAKAAATASLLVATSLVRAEQTKELLGVHNAVRDRWVLREIKVHPAFFSEWNNWFQSLASGS